MAKIQFNPILVRDSFDNVPPNYSIAARHIFPVPEFPDNQMLT